MTQLNLVRVLKAGAVASVLALSGLAAQAQGHWGHGGPGMEGGPMMGHALDAADATDAQRAQIKSIMQAAHADLKPLMANARALHKQAAALFAAPTIDANAIEQLRLQGQALHGQISARMSQAMVAAANVLTPAQRATIAAKMARREARMEAHMKAHDASKAAAGN